MAGTTRLISIVLSCAVSTLLTIQKVHSGPVPVARTGNLTNIGEILQVLKETEIEPMILKGQDQNKMVIVMQTTVLRQIKPANPETA